MCNKRTLSLVKRWWEARSFGLTRQQKRFLSLQMAEGGVERISQSLDSISLSSNPEERDAMEKALNLDENHAMLPDDMIRKVKRQEDEKQ